MIDKIKNWALLAPALIPLVYLDIFFFPLVAPKAFFFRIAVTVLLLAVTCLAYNGKGLYIKRLLNWWTLIPGALLLVAYTTSIFGVDFYHSFWSVFDRSSGLVALTYMVGYFYLLLLTISKDFIFKFFSLTAGVASVAGVYAILQWVGDIGSFHIPGLLDPQGGRIGATIGNAAFLAGYLGLTFFITLITAYRSTRHEQWWYAGALIQLIAIILTATRGTILALLAMLGVALVYAAIQKEGKVRRYAQIGIVSGIILFAGFIGFRMQLQQVPFEPIQRIASIGVEDATTASRLFVWENMLSYGLAKPFTGYGSEHIDYVFDQFYNAQDIVEQWFDRSHNLYLDYFIQYGVLGLILFVLFIAALFRVGLRTRKEDLFIGNMLLLLVGTYVLQSVFVFDTINTLVVLIPLFAIGFIKEEDALEVGAFNKIGLTIVTIIAVPGLYFTVFLPAYANLELGKSYMHHVVDAQKYKEHFDRGFSLDTYANLEFGYQAYAMYTDRQQYMLSGEDKNIAYQVAYNALEKNTQKYPYDARTFVYLGHVLEARPEGVAYSPEENLEILQTAQSLSPDRSQPYYMMANFYIERGNVSSGTERENYYQAAIDIVIAYRDRAPEIAEPYLVLAELYRVTGNTSLSQEAFETGINLYKGDTQDARRIAGRLLAQNKISEARPYLETVYRQSPHDYVAIFDLAKVRFIEGDIEGSVELVELVQLKQPELLDTDPLFLQQLINILQ
ncbi:MAG: O-antigen ligase family protein [Patescibacteria group bacterium UBA2103]